MKLSMNMLAWYLRDYHPQKNIGEDSLSIQGMRFLPEETITSQPDYIYFGDADQFFYGKSQDENYIIINNLGSLIFHNCVYEDLLNSILSAFDFFNSWESEMLQARAEHAPLQKFADLLYKVACNQTVISRLDGPLLAVSGFKRTNDPIWESNVDNMFLHPAVINTPYFTTDGIPIKHLFKPRIVKNVYAEGAPVIMKYLSTDSESVGLLAFKQDDASLTELNMQLADIAEDYLLAADEFTSSTSLYRTGVSVARSLLEAQPVSDAAVEKIFRGFPGVYFRLAIVRHKTRHDYIQQESLIRSLRNVDTKVITFIFNESVIAILADLNVSEAFLCKKAGLDLCQLTISVSMASDVPTQLPLLYEQAQFVESMAGDSPGLFKCENFAFQYMIQWLHGNSLTGSLVCPAFRILENHDRATGSDLYNTLLIYAECGFHIRNSSSRLNIHENTMKYRLQKIRELTDLTLKDSTELRYLALSSWLLS